MQLDALWRAASLIHADHQFLTCEALSGHFHKGGTAQVRSAACPACDALRSVTRFDALEMAQNVNITAESMEGR